MHKFFKEFPLHMVFAASALFLALSSVLAWYHLTEQKEFLILHFDTYRGIDFFGNIEVVYQILIISATIVLLNFFLASVLFYREKFFSYALAFGSLFCGILLLIGISVIVLVN